MSSKIIKLRESESTAKTQNADYSIVLDKAVTMLEGDTLRIKSVFLDTVSASGDFIEILEPVNIEIDVAKWLINDSKDQKYPSPHETEQLRQYVPADPANPTSGPATLSTIGDAGIYFACNKSTTTGQTESLESFAYFPIHFGLHTVGGFDLEFTYDRVGGGKGFFQHHVVSEPGSDLPRRKGKVITKTIYMEEKSFTCTNTDEAKKHGIDPQKFIFKYNTKPASGEEIAVLDTETFTYRLDPGVYTPTQLGEILTDEMTKIDSLGPIGNNLVGESYTVNNPFLTTVSQLYTKAAASTHASQSFFCNLDGTQFLKYNPIGTMRTRGVDRFIGASQVALTYDENHKKLSFSILHTPEYVNETTGENDAVPGISYDHNRLIDSYSGCCFSRLSPPDFWTNLGFSNVIVAPNLENVIPDAGGIMGGTVRSLSMAIGVGTNRTAGFESLDTPVQKNTNFRIPNPTGEISTSATLPIFGTRIFANDFSGEGYYLIELDCGIAQDLVGANGNIGFNSKKIHSIVSNYFSQGNYTSDQGSGSIGYLHKGNPILLSNFNVRILQADGSVPDPISIGNHNTVFLELISKDMN